MRKRYDLGFIIIDTRLFYTNDSCPESKGIWRCGESNCGCGDLKYLNKWRKKGDIITKVPLYQKIEFRFNYLWLFLISNWVWLFIYYLTS